MLNPASPSLRLGTRGSPLALTQARMVADRLIRQEPGLGVEIVKIRASGDHDPLKDKDEPLIDRGGKGLFTKELEEALLDGRIDLAVHSMKDVPTWLPQGLALAAVLPREDPRDAFISMIASCFEELPSGAMIGTSSLRRQAQILNLRPDLKAVPLRGNVDTRLRKMEQNQADATFLAYAGLLRLGLTHKATEILEPGVMLPSAGQGIIGIEIRQKDAALAEKLEKINCVPTFTCLAAERAMLEVLDGSCRTPIAGLAVIGDGQLYLRGLVAHPDGKGVWRAEEKAPLEDSSRLGKEVGRLLRSLVPPGILPD
jgi:hydroxymethylbilane synthase